MIRIKSLFLLAAPLMMSYAAILHAEEKTAVTTGNDTFQKVNFMIDLSAYQGGSGEKWMEGKGFQFETEFP